MKKIFILSIVGLIIALGIITAFYYADEDLSDEDIVSIIKPEIDSYCNVLAENANSSVCPTCRYGTNNNYVRVNEFSISYSIEYIVTELPKLLQINVSIPTIYGWNTRSGGSPVISFEIDKKGNLISKEMPVAQCL